MVLKEFIEEISKCPTAINNYSEKEYVYGSIDENRSFIQDKRTHYRIISITGAWYDIKKADASLWVWVINELNQLSVITLKVFNEVYTIVEGGESLPKPKKKKNKKNKDLRKSRSLSPDKEKKQVSDDQSLVDSPINS